ncbi:hypothetical protein PC111_g4276 [Phytophthora cactorum]|nr:hypothetical protein PC111_g4276 [Phytophthora cactorum]
MLSSVSYNLCEYRNLLFQYLKDYGPLNTNHRCICSFRTPQLPNHGLRAPPSPFNVHFRPSSGVLRCDDFDEVRKQTRRNGLTIKFRTLTQSAKLTKN